MSNPVAGGEPRCRRLRGSELARTASAGRSRCASEWQDYPATPPAAAAVRRTTLGRLLEQLRPLREPRRRRSAGVPCNVTDPSKFRATCRRGRMI